MAADLELLERHAPIVRFNEGEYFLPASVEAFVGCAELWQRTGPTSRVLAAPAGTLDLGGLVALTEGRTAEHYLRLVSEPMGRAELLSWRLRGDRPRFRAEMRLGRVGVLARLVDLGARASLLLRGRVPTGDEARAALLSRERPDTADHPYYGRVVRSAGFVVLQYWYFYFFNDWRSRAHGVNDHEGDWEQVSIYLADSSADPGSSPNPGDPGDPDEPDDLGDLRPAWVAFSSHDTVGADLRRRWDDPDLTTIDGHPVVHAGLGSHAGAFLAGEYVTVVRTERFAGLGRLANRLGKILLPWQRGRQADGVGIPYVDYKRGDGVAIGAGQERAWRPVVVDDETPWVREYSGLWGNDTDDRFGGERGPAGPRYERTGAVRRSWADPVNWAALDGVIPDGRERRAVIEARTSELTTELAAIEVERSERRDRLRAAVLGGAVGTTDEAQQLATLAGRAVARADELRRLEQLTTEGEPVVGPHAHLRFRPMPLPDEPGGRRRFLRLWATISTPLLFLLIALMVASDGWRIVSSIAMAVLVVLTLEAIARRKLASFLVTVVSLALVAVVVLAIVGALIASWRLTVVVLLLVAAAACLIANVRELTRN